MELSLFSPFLLSLVSVLFCSCVTYSSSYLLAKVPGWTDRHLPYLLAFGSGALVGDAFLHVIPHVVTSIAERHSCHSHHASSHHHHSGLESAASQAGICFLGGILFAYLIESVCHCLQRFSSIKSESWNMPDKKAVHEDKKVDTQTGSLRRRTRTPIAVDNGEKPSQTEGALQKLLSNPTALTNLCCDLLHNCEFCTSTFTTFLQSVADGISLSVTAAASRRLGVSSTLAVISHEVAQEVADFSLLRHSGMVSPLIAPTKADDRSQFQ